jgi:hypothetical protein
MMKRYLLFWAHYWVVLHHVYDPSRCMDYQSFHPRQSLLRCPASNHLLSNSHLHNLAPTKIADIRVYQHTLSSLALTLFELRDVSEYLEDLLARIDAPQSRTEVGRTR